MKRGSWIALQHSHSSASAHPASEPQESWTALQHGCNSVNTYPAEEGGSRTVLQHRCNSVNAHQAEEKRDQGSRCKVATHRQRDRRHAFIASENGPAGLKEGQEVILKRLKVEGFDLALEELSREKESIGVDTGVSLKKVERRDVEGIKCGQDVVLIAEDQAGGGHTGGVHGSTYASMRIHAGAMITGVVGNTRQRTKQEQPLVWSYRSIGFSGSTG
ncbi:hypothetical protein BC939DRAFT_508617 [Gamsiella multidivaricata]|uniref:uncharacterized protein n=1 Tax=Gamsiella multidivaricata TaxID=101098 RepID=UPI00221E4122|nr:uncharacterized protein BC939DRAFT_508617 [Gamsiella multidivaricata]KAI7816108.1 hypothetical protein BC939DRAFT_508617 [Gamsiella multidivaricata]